MNICFQDWLGRWESFEHYFPVTHGPIAQAWEEAEALCRSHPIMSRIFRSGCKNFWMRACRTAAPCNSVVLSGWEIAHADAEQVTIHWLGEGGVDLGTLTYAPERILAHGLEGKEMLLLRAKDAPKGCPFRYLLTTEVMTARSAKEQGGLLSHIHFQYAPEVGALIQGQRLMNHLWYATVCDADGTEEQKAAIVRALHNPHIWEQVPMEQVRRPQVG